jgi:2-dehydropantoate 2-reductase
MRYIIYGAGAIGGVLGGLLHVAGTETVLICRGAHLDAIQRHGLTMLTPTGSVKANVPAVGHPRELEFRSDDVAILTMKSQDTERALLDLEAAGGGNLPIVCCQNGVDNERLAARRFANVYGMLVAMPANYLHPGSVTSFGDPIAGVLDCGRYPRGTDAVIETVAADITAAGFSSRAVQDIMPLKYAKLLSNLNNALSALTKTSRTDPLVQEISQSMLAEANACLEAAGIACPTRKQYDAEISVRYRSIDAQGEKRGGTSTWQSLMRGLSSVEVDYLNGEIVLLGTLHDVPTPVNARIRQLVQQMASRSEPVGHYTADQLREALQLTPVGG